MRKSIALSESDIQRLNEGREAKGWSREDDSEALIEASRYLIESLIEQTNRNSYQISLECLKTWIAEEKIYITSEKKQEFNRFESEQTQASKTLILSSIVITLEEINQLIDNRVIRAKGISQDSLRWCTELNYIKRKNLKKQKPKQIPFDVVEAYCEIFGLNISTLDGYGDSSQIQLKQKSEQLYHILTQFNHDEITKYLKSELASQPIRKDIFYFSVFSELCEIWLLRRLEKEINTLGNFETHKIIFDLAEKNQVWEVGELFNHFYQNARINSIDGLLKHKNLILLFKNIDAQSQEYLRNIVLKGFWQSLTRNIKKSRGFLLMVWLDRGKKNDWRDRFECSEKIYKPLMTSNFSQQDFEVLLSKLAEEFQQPDLSSNQQDEINHLWQASQQGQVEATLQAFYRRFNGKLASETRWQNYP